ncbi:RhuM family protein [Veillonella sp. R32]|uniref:RhuM family protein n=1 Tax=Veillonella sp. R32 TaxID=2021312 RepID=UPI00192E88FD|nr:RhuM family protein [Veillonella sp. R32]
MLQSIIFKDGALEIPVQVSEDKENIWLRPEDMALLFDRDRTVITRHIRNIYKEDELEENSTCANFAQVQKEGARLIERNYKYYNLDVIISVGYRVKSKKGIAFRHWATKILKEYIIKGYAINQKRLQALNKVVEIQSNILANTLEINSADLLNVIEQYTTALELLDDYDHKKIVKPNFNSIENYQITYADAQKLIDEMKLKFQSDIFGQEKSKGILNGIIRNIYQTAFGEEIYKSTQEKAANLLYFIIKDHPFTDGCKRIAASLFLYFLSQNNLLLANGTKIISESTLVAITLLIAESKADEKDIMINIILNFLSWK